MLKYIIFIPIIIPFLNHYLSFIHFHLYIFNKNVLLIFYKGFKLHNFKNHRYIKFNSELIY